MSRRGPAAAPRPIRVVHVAESAGWAGGEVYLRELARALPRERFELAVIVPETGPLVSRLQAEGVQTVVLPQAGSLASPRFLRELVRRPRAPRPPIAQSHR